MADVFQLLGAPLPTTLLSCCDDEAWMNANALKPTWSLYVLLGNTSREFVSHHQVTLSWAPEPVSVWSNNYTVYPQYVSLQDQWSFWCYGVLSEINNVFCWSSPLAIDHHSVSLKSDLNRTGACKHHHWPIDSSVRNRKWFPIVEPFEVYTQGVCILIVWYCWLLSAWGFRFQASILSHVR